MFADRAKPVKPESEDQEAAWRPWNPPSHRFVGAAISLPRAEHDMTALSDLATAVLGLSAGHANDLNVLQIAARAIVMYLVLIAYVRLGKKRFLGEATAFDAILVIMIGSLASRGISGNAPFQHALVSVLVLIAMHWVLSYFAAGWPTISAMAKGHDTVLVREGRVDRTALHAAHMSDDDLDEDLRQKGVSSPAEVEEARLERSGIVSVIKKR